MNQPATFRRGRRPAAALAVAAMVAVSGCGAVNAINKIKNAVQGNEAIIDTFAGRMAATSGLAYQATYTATGTSPGTVTYAVKPPKLLAFTLVPAVSDSVGGLGRTDIVANASGGFSCALVPAPGSGWTCRKLGATAAAAKNKIVSFYTPSHWVTFLQDFSVAAGFAGDKITTSAKTVNGIRLDCIGFRASGVPGTSTLCTTSKGILGYVNVVTAAASFEIKSYSPSPPASLFALPRGAKVTRAKGSG
jgi:hypothetical protein